MKISGYPITVNPFFQFCASKFPLQRENGETKLLQKVCANSEWKIRLLCCKSFQAIHNSLDYICSTNFRRWFIWESKVLDKAAIFACVVAYSRHSLTSSRKGQRSEYTLGSVGLRDSFATAQPCYSCKGMQLSLCSNQALFKFHTISIHPGVWFSLWYYFGHVRI